ncbi:MAG: hypothetical protein WD045_14110 [Pirellulaceae bacterium]
MRTLLLMIVTLPFMVPDTLYAQRRGAANRQNEQSAMPGDPRLLSIHRDFITKAESLGDEYARKKDWEKSRVVFEEILKLVPSYRPASDKLKLIHDALGSINKAEVTVKAEEGWQDTGILLEAGSPVNFKTEGKWLFAYESDGDGFEIPREMQEFQLGSLIGVIVDTPMPGPNAKPFAIGKSSEMSAPEGGRLFLKMHATNNEGCRGTMDVEVSGNFKDPIVRAGRR